MAYNTSMNYRVFLLNHNNSSCLDSLAPEVFDNPVDTDQLRRFLDDPRHLMLVAMEDDQVVGMASAVEYFHPDKPPQLWINEVGVSPAFRRKGIGRALTAGLVQLAKDRACVFAWLGTEKDNRSGQACFGSVPDVESPREFLLYEWDLEDSES